MVLTLLQQRCTNHPQREASARCPSCRRYFCRECITEHDDRVLCASCLAKLGAREKERGSGWSWAPRAGLALLALGVIFLILMTVGSLLLAIPSHFHEQGGW